MRGRAQGPVDERAGRAEVVLRAARTSMPSRRASASVSSAMFARMRSASTCRPSSERRIAAAAPPVAASAVASACHSACQAPAARSCSCTALSSEHAPRSRARAARRRRRGPRSTGLRLCGIVDEPPPSRLRHLADLGLREQHDVAADLRRRAAAPASAPREVGERRAERVPGQGRLAQAELRRVQAQHLRPVVAERRQRAGGAAELRRQLERARAAPAPRRGRRASPPPCSRRSSARPAAAASARPSPCSRCSSARRAQAAAAPPSSSSISRSARCATSIAAVSRMSWLVAPQVNEAGVLLADLRADRAHERLDRVAGGAAVARERVAVVELGAAGGGDRRRGRGRHEPARAPRRVDERALGVEHRVEPRAVGHSVRQLVGHEDRRERAHMREEDRLARRPACGCRSASRPSSALRDERRAIGLAERREAPGRRRSPPARRGSRCASAGASAGRARRRRRRGAAPRRAGAAGFAITNENRPPASCRSGPTGARPASPDLDHPVGDRRAVAVEQLAAQPRSPTGSPAGTSSFSARAAEPDRVDGPDRLRRRRVERHCVLRSGSCRSAAAEHDVPAVAERPLGLSSSSRSNRETAARAPSGRGPSGRSGRTRTAGRRGSTSA